MEGHTFVIKLRDPDIEVKAKSLESGRVSHVIKCPSCDVDVLELKGKIEEIRPIPGSGLEGLIDWAKKND